MDDQICVRHFSQVGTVKSNIMISQHWNSEMFLFEQLFDKRVFFPQIRSLNYLCIFTIR